MGAKAETGKGRIIKARRRIATGKIREVTDCEIM